MIHLVAIMISDLCEGIGPCGSERVTVKYADLEYKTVSDLVHDTPNLG